MTSSCLVNIGPGNSLPSGAKPLPEPRPGYCKLVTQEYISVKSLFKIRTFLQSSKRIWNFIWKMAALYSINVWTHFSTQQHDGDMTDGHYLENMCIVRHYPYFILWVNQACADADLNSSPLGQNCRHFGRRHFQMHFLGWKCTDSD